MNEFACHSVEFGDALLACLCVFEQYSEPWGVNDETLGDFEVFVRDPADVCWAFLNSGSENA